MNEHSKTIVSNIRRLSSSDLRERTSARIELEQGAPASTWFLIQASQPTSEKTREEAFHALVKVADPRAIDLFVEALDDGDSEYRWLAALGLAGLGQVGLTRVLELLVDSPRTNRSLGSLHHALSELQKGGFNRFTEPVLQAFGGADPNVEIPTAAHKALIELRIQATNDPNPPAVAKGGGLARKNSIEIESIDDFAEVVLRGKLTRDVYEVFVPAIEAQIHEFGKLRMLLVLEDFHGWTAGAVWEDLKFDLKHFRDISRLAIVGENQWQHGMAIFCKPFTTAKVQYFDHTKLESAREWLNEVAPAH